MMCNSNMTKANAACQFPQAVMARSDVNPTRVKPLARPRLKQNVPKLKPVAF